MIIRNPKEFKTVIAEVPAQLQTDRYFLLHTTKEFWRAELNTRLKTIGDDELLHLALLVKHDEPRIDNILVSCKRNEMTEEFITVLANYIHDVKSVESPLKFLERKWCDNPSRYPLLMMLTTRLKAEYDDYTVLCYLAIAPAFREQGLMKRICLNLIELLQREFGPEHLIKAFAIHKATYLFFNPADKECKHFHPQELQDLCCSLLLNLHGRNKQEVADKTVEQIVITELGLKALQLYGILKSSTTQAGDAEIQNHPTPQL